MCWSGQRKISDYLYLELLALVNCLTDIDVQNKLRSSARAIKLRAIALTHLPILNLKN